MANKENEIFNGKTFQDLTKDIYENSKNKKLQIDLLIQEIHGMITTIDDAVMVAPIIKEYMDVSIKNDLQGESDRLSNIKKKTKGFMED